MEGFNLNSHSVDQTLITTCGVGKGNSGSARGSGDTFGSFTGRVGRRFRVGSLQGVRGSRIRSCTKSLGRHFRRRGVDTSATRGCLSGVGITLSRTQYSRRLRVGPMGSTNLPGQAKVTADGRDIALTRRGRTMGGISRQLKTVVALRERFNLQFGRSYLVSTGDTLRRTVGGRIVAIRFKAGNKGREAVPVSSRARVSTLRETTSVRGRRRSVVPTRRG